MATQIKNLQDLKDRATEEGGCECFVSLAGGMVKSSKQIWYWPETNTWDWHNDIDESDFEEQGLDVMMAESNIIEALNSGALYAY